MDICPKSSDADISPHDGTLEDLPKMTTRHDAVELLARTYRGRLVAAAREILGDHDLAEDAAQETLLRALESWDPSRPVGESLAWALVVVRRIALDIARSRRTRKAEGIGMCPDWIEDRSRYADPADEAADREEWGLAHAAFEDAVPMRSDAQFRALMHTMHAHGRPAATHARDLERGIVTVRRRLPFVRRAKSVPTLKSAV